MAFEKVFGVGLNKTGTTTLGDMLSQFGLAHQSWKPTNFEAYRQSNTAKLIAATHSHDSFSDWPWPLVTKELLAHFDDRARYILTRRANVDVWLESLKGHALITKPKHNARTAVYGYEYPHENEQAHKDFYLDHLDATRQLFLDEGREHLLLEVCWEDGDGWGQVAKLLSFRAPDAVIPHHNSKDTRRAHLRHKAANLAQIGRLITQPAIRV